MPGIKKNTWEYLDLKTTKIPENIRNTSDPKVIEDYLKTDGGALSDKEREYLNHHMQSLNKINTKIQEVKNEVANGSFKNYKPDVMALDDLELYSLSGYSFNPVFQTGDFGCWSCFYNFLLESRSVRNLTQEDIRAYRPKKNGHDPYNIDSDREFNEDVPLNAIDMADLAINLIPDTMVKSIEIYSYNKYMGNAPQTPEAKLAYSAAAIKAIKEQIITSIRDHRSPVGLMMNGHYVTITGIEGDTISYYNSMPNSDPNRNAEYVYQEDLSSFLDSALNGENADALTLTWLEDIKLSKEGNTIYGTSLPNLTVAEDGTLQVNAKESQNMFSDDRHQDGMVIGTTGGIDIADADSQHRRHLTDGFFKVDKAYLPKKLNMTSLRQKATGRSNEEEALLKADRNKKLAAQRAIQDSIALNNANGINIIEEEAAPQIPRFVIPVQFTGKPNFGGGSFVDFKNTLSGMGWDKNKFETLLGAFSNLYDALPVPEGSPQKQAMDILYTNSFFGEKEYPGTIRELKATLTEYLNSIQNGNTFYNDFGNQVKLNGIKKKRNLKPEVTASVKYIQSYIKALSAIEKYNPNLSAGAVDIDSFIAPDGTVRTEDIKNNLTINVTLAKKKAAEEKKAASNKAPVNKVNAPKQPEVKKPEPVKAPKQPEVKQPESVKAPKVSVPVQPAPQKQPEVQQPKEKDPIIEDNKGVFMWVDENDVFEPDIKYEEDGIRISPKCKYKLYNNGETLATALKKLTELDKVPSEEKDKNLVFSLILINAYWKPQQDYDAIYLTDEDLNFLAERYENDPSFAKNVEAMVEYGYGLDFWGNRDLMVEYIYHSKYYEPRQISEFEEKRAATYDEDVPGGASVKAINRAEQQMASKLRTIKSSKQQMIKSEKKEAAKDQTTIAAEFSLLQEDLRRGKHVYTDVSYSKRPKVDYRKAADIIIRSEAKRPFLYEDKDTAFQFEERNNQLAKKSEELANELNFMMFIQENKDAIPAMSVEEFKSGYTEFNKAALQADAATDKFENTFGMNDYLVISKAEIQRGCKTYIQNTAKRKQPFGRAQIMDAADLIIAKTLTAKAADAAVFNKLNIVGNEDNVLDQKKFKETVTQMRAEIIANPLFKNILAKRVPASEFYEEYRKAINIDVNKKRADDLVRRKAINKTRSEKERINTFMSENTHKLTAEQAKEIKTAYENLLEYNKGKSPSDLMKKFMKSLKDVVTELDAPDSKREVHMDKLSSLNRYTLKYYDKRQGTFSDPHTDGGKSRLSAAERLSKTTDAIIKNMAEVHPELKPGYVAPEGAPAQANNEAKNANESRRNSNASIEENGVKRYELPRK